MGFSFDSVSGLYSYKVRGSRDIQDRRGNTEIFFDADTGELRLLIVAERAIRRQYGHELALRLARSQCLRHALPHFRMRAWARHHHAVGAPESTSGGKNAARENFPLRGDAWRGL